MSGQLYDLDSASAVITAILSLSRERVTLTEITQRRDLDRCLQLAEHARVEVNSDIERCETMAQQPARGELRSMNASAGYGTVSDSLLYIRLSLGCAG